MIEQILTEPTGMIVGWLVRGSLLLTALFLLAALLRREPSSTRHLLWTAGIAVALTVPIVSAWVPAWEIGIPTEAAIVPGAAPQTPDRGSESSPAEGRGGPELAAPRSATAPATDQTTPATPTTNPVTQTSSPFPGPDFIVPALVALWFFTAFFFLMRFVASVLRTRAIVREASPVSDPLWNRSLLEISDRLELSEAPRLLMSGDAKVPMTCGVLRPAVVLPDDATDWPVNRRQAVLCHELAHIQRRDLLSHLLGHITCAFYWFYPLAWKAARLQRAESERACDDLVLSLGIRPSAYADHLLQIATAGHGADTPAAALPMARPKEFEARLLSILAPGMPRESTRGWRALAPLVLVVATAAPLVALSPTPVPREPAAVPSDETEWSDVAGVSDVAGASDVADADAEDGSRGWVSVDAGPGDNASVSIMDLITVDVEEGEPGRVEVGAPTTQPLPVEDEYEKPLPFDNSGSGLDANADTVHFPELERRTARLGEHVAEFINDAALLGAAVGETVGRAIERAVETRSESGRSAEDSFTRTLPVSGPVELEVMTGSGQIEILEGRGDRVEVHGTIEVRERGRTRAEAEALAGLIAANPPIQHEGNGVRVGDADGMDLPWADEDNVSISYHILVPNRTSVSSHTGSGSQTIHGISGEVEATTGSGNVELGQIAGDVLAGTGSGSIRADGIGGAFKGSAGSGSIRLVQTRPGEVEVNTGSGAIRVEGIQGSLRAETGSGSIEAGGAAGPSDEWVLRTGSGRVMIDLPDDAAFDLNARSGSGSINIDHPITVRGALTGFFTRLSSNRHREINGSVRGGGAALDIETGSGSISIE